MESVAAFTDTYLPTVNGVTYTISDWRVRWRDRGGRMDIVYPRMAGHTPDDGEVPVRSLPFPFYEGFRYGLPVIPESVRDVDVVHAHTPFPIGVGGLRLARSEDLPLVASYHTPTGEYTDYLMPGHRLAAGIRRLSETWERWFFDRADVVVVPSGPTREYLTGYLSVSSPVEVVPNGVDTDRFEPVDPSRFLERHGIDTEHPLVGYTGRHGHEKRLHELIDAAADIDVTVIFGGDGPARTDLERRADRAGVDARFLGFLPREELPAFYSALDVFAFPSPVETQGIVALEAMACGTPVVAVESGALRETIEDDVTGYHFHRGDLAGFRDGITKALTERQRLREGCLSRRESFSIERTVDRLAELYAAV